MSRADEYREALDALKDDGEYIAGGDKTPWSTIRRALRIAHRLTQEPSEEIIAVLERCDLTAEEAYADMAAELIKQAEKGE